MSRARGHSIPVRSPDPVPGVAQILIVCHANQCRSPFAEAMARRIAGSRPRQFSTGGLIHGGHPMPETGRVVGREYGFDFAAHRSREVDLADFGGFDLVLTMAREQARELVAADPDAWPRIFTLKQFARWIRDNPRPRRSVLGSWLDVSAGDRPRASLLGDSAKDDVADPLRLPADAWRTMARELRTELTTVIDGLTPASTSG